MTHPSLNQTFDTSLIDLKEDYGMDIDTDPRLSGSFSTTDTDASDYEQRARATVAKMEAKQKTRSADDTPKAQHQAMFSTDTGSTGATIRNETVSPMASSGASPSLDAQGKPKRPTKYLPTVDAYNEWAAVYDTDGNILQAVDDLELERMLPDMLRLVTSDPVEKLTIYDVGCGTGRNTSKLLSFHWPSGTKVEVTGLEMSSGMLQVAEKKLRPLVTSLPNVSLQLIETDAFAAEQAIEYPRADALISTLVLEHIQLEPFFKALASLLRPGGYAVVTNMHQEMGLQSQAGFVAADGTKVRGTSWAHGVDDTRSMAEDEGFEVVGVVKERGIDEGMVGSVVGERGKKWVGCQVWYGMILKLSA